MSNPQEWMRQNAIQNDLDIQEELQEIAENETNDQTDGADPVQLQPILEEPMEPTDPPISTHTITGDDPLVLESASEDVITPVTTT
jgi:hypothetical protein